MKVTVDQDIAEAELAAAGVVDSNLRAPHIDPETAKAYNEYLRDWRWNMSTWRAIERQQMGGRSYLSNSQGEYY